MHCCSQSSLRCSLSVRFALPHASALFYGSRSLSRTWARLPTVCVAAATYHLRCCCYLPLCITAATYRLCCRRRPCQLHFSSCRFARETLHFLLDLKLASRFSSFNNEYFTRGSYFDILQAPSSFQPLFQSEFFVSS